jgi:hypothetical protein
MVSCPEDGSGVFLHGVITTSNSVTVIRDSKVSRITYNTDMIQGL